MNLIKKAAGQTATSEKTRLNYAPLGILVQANINGQRLAAAVLDQLHRHYADPDALYLALKAITHDSHDIDVLATMRGFMRTLQKRIERTA